MDVEGSIPDREKPLKTLSLERFWPGGASKRIAETKQSGPAKLYEVKSNE